MNALQKEMMACQEVMEACLESKEPTPMEVNVVAEVPKEEVEVETIGALEDRYGDQHLAVGRRRQLKRWTQGNGGSRKKLVTTCIRMTHHALPAWRKGHSHKGHMVEKR
jgi:hypothetical protein